MAARVLSENPSRCTLSGRYVTGMKTVGTIPHQFLQPRTSFSLSMRSLSTYAVLMCADTAHLRSSPRLPTCCDPTYTPRSMTGYWCACNSSSMPLWDMSMYMQEPFTHPSSHCWHSECAHCGGGVTVNFACPCIVQIYSSLFRMLKSSI